MGFHLVEKVYANVTGTSPTAQAVLAFLAHRADDKGVRKCFPSTESIGAATHFKHTAVRNALNELCEAHLLSWTSGGRLKGRGGKALANEYALNLPDKPPKSCSRQTANALAVKRPMHTPPDGQCISRQTATINKDQPLSQPSVNGATEAATVDLKSAFEGVADIWSAKRERVEAQATEERRDREERRHHVVDEAMAACEVSDMENRRIFSSTLIRRDPERALDVIWRFGSEYRAGEYKNLRNPAAQLNKLLALLPVIN